MKEVKRYKEVIGTTSFKYPKIRSKINKEVKRSYIYKRYDIFSFKGKAFLKRCFRYLLYLFTSLPDKSA